jgi:hypothetical protein
MGVGYSAFWELRQGQSAGDGIHGQDTHRRRVFLVKLAAIPLDGSGAFQALSCYQVPAKGSAISGDKPTVVCLYRHAELDNERTRTLYRVTCHYGVDTVAGGNIGLGIPPWDRRSIPSFTTKDYERVLEKDFAGKAILNWVKDPPDPPIMTRVVSCVAVVPMARKISDLDYDGAIVPLVNTVNLSAVTINGKTYAKGRCKLLEAPANPASFQDSYGNEIPYWNLTLHIEISKDVNGFNGLKRLSTGFHCYKTASTPSTYGSILVPAFNYTTGLQEGSTTPAQAVVLKNDGTQLPHGSDPVDADYQTFMEFQEADWSALRLA